MASVLMGVPSMSNMKGSVFIVIKKKKKEISMMSDEFTQEFFGNPDNINLLPAEIHIFVA